MKILSTPLTIPIFSTVASLTLLTSLSAQAASIAPIWKFNFTDDITGSGTINLDVNDFDSNTESYLVTALDFTLNFGVDSDPQSISLANFPVTQPLRFNPNDRENELYSTLAGSLVPEWRIGTIPNVGGFNLSGSPGIGLPDDPDGVGGVIVFRPVNTTEEITGTWTATPVSEPFPEPLTLLGAGVAMGLGTFFKHKIKATDKNNS
ncbi:MAG: PEP-CTERM sorting domain-containing protein [Crocosphaera sp.]|nr:PEP-CTERM sorting domain-containing protein [Crocosphaera sp.]